MAEDCIELRMVVGRYAVTVRGENPKVVVKQIAFFSELPEKCPVCGALVRLTYREPKDFTFYGLACLGEPSHETTFGVHKTGDGLFYKKSEPWTVHQRGGGDDQTPYDDPPYETGHREPPQPARGNQPEYGRPARTQPPGDYRRR